MNILVSAQILPNMALNAIDFLSGGILFFFFRVAHHLKSKKSRKFS